MMHHYKTCILSLLDYDACCHNLGSNTMNLLLWKPQIIQTRRKEEERSISVQVADWASGKQTLNCCYMYSILNKMEKICVWCKSTTQYQ